MKQFLAVFLVVVLVGLLIIGCGTAAIDSADKRTVSSRSTKPIAGDINGHITVSPEERIGSIDPKLLGVHVPAWNETLIQNGRIHPRFLNNAKKAGLRFLVYPGGNYGYDFVWNDRNLPTEMDTDQFLEICRRLKAVPKISLNPNESPKLAADWLRYVNKEKKADVKYWEIADEPYLMMSAEEFIKKVKAFVPCLKKVDPSIKIVANVSVANPDYTKKVIKQVGKDIDVYSIHFLPLPPSKRFDPNSPYTVEEKEKFFEDLLKSPSQIHDQLMTLKSWVKEAYPHKKVEYHVGSFNTVWWGPEDWTVNFLPAGLWTADLLGTFAKEQIDAAAYWALMNPFPPGQGDFGMLSPEMKPHVDYYAFELYAEHFGNVIVQSVSDVRDLSSYASLSKDGNVLYLMLVNKSPDQDYKVHFDLGNFNPRGEAAAWILDGPTMADHVYDYGLRKEMIHHVNQKFTWTVPSYSAVAIEIPGIQSKHSLDDTPNLALNKRVKASSEAFGTDTKYYRTNEFAADKAIDGDLTTRWAAGIFQKNEEWFQVDLGQVQPFNSIRLNWEYWATSYAVEVSSDGEHWKDIADNSQAIRLKEPPQPVEEITWKQPIRARYVRISMTSRPDKSGAKAGTSQWTPDAFSLWEMGVYLK